MHDRVAGSLKISLTLTWRSKLRLLAQQATSETTDP